MGLWRRKKVRKIGRVLVLLDLDNLVLNLNIHTEAFSFGERLDVLMRELGAIGQIENVFVFASPATASLHLETLFRHGFWTMPCPRLRNKEGQERDTVDQTLMDFGRRMFAQMHGLTHLCLGSGDKDFIPLLREAVRRGLKIILVAGNTTSLALELIDHADFFPEQRRKMVFILSPPPNIPSAS